MIGENVNFVGKAREHIRFITKGNYRTALDYVDSTELALFQWLSVNTSKGDVILHPPEMVYIRAIANRSSVFQHHLVSFNPKGMEEWMRRSGKTKNYCQKSSEELKDIALAYEATWIIIERRCPAAVSRKAEYDNSAWLVFKTFP